MGILMTKEDDKNEELTRRINADLREKAEATSKDAEIKAKNVATDFAEDIDYNKGLKQTTKFGWVFPLVIFVGFVVAIVAVFALK